MPQPLNLALGLAGADFPRAFIWAYWLRALGGLEHSTLFLSALPAVPEQDLGRLIEVLTPAVAAIDYAPYEDPDPGYPGGANRIFIQTMRRAAEAGAPALWVESDFIPITADWFATLRDDYYAQGKPFYGPHLSSYDVPHMNGTAIYPADWEARSNIAECPDHFPWDTFCRHSIQGQAFDTPLMQHSYSHASFPRDQAKVREGIVAFHPCKDGSLIPHLDTDGLLPPEAYEVPVSYFLLQGYHPRIHKYPGAFKVRMPGAQWWAIKADSLSTYALLTRVGGLRPISEADFLQYQSQI